MPNQALYVQNRDSVMFRIDPVTGEKLDASAGVSAFGAAMQDMAMLEVFATADNPLAMGVYRAYLLGPQRSAGQYLRQRLESNRRFEPVHRCN